MSKTAIMPFADYKAVCNSVRAKTGKTDLIKSGDLATEIDSIEVGGGGSDEVLRALAEGTLTDIDIPEGTTKIGTSAFRGNLKIKNIDIPTSVGAIEATAFYECTNLETISGAENVTTIYSAAFQNCQNLVTIPTFPNLTSVKKANQFYGCYKLESVDFPLLKVFGGAYGNDNGTAMFSGCRALKSVNIPSATILGSRLFYGCISLEHIILPATVFRIYDQAFRECTSLAVVDFSALTQVPTLSNANAFTNVPDTCKLILPDALYDEWIVATNWSALTVTYVKKSEYDAGGTTE